MSMIWVYRPETKDTEVRDYLSAVIKMFDLRKSVDHRLKNAKSGGNTPVRKLWKTPEALIANAVELSEILQKDGHTEEESIKKFLFFIDRPMPADDCTDLMSYLQYRLQTIDPEYLSLGYEFLSQVVEIAKEAAGIEIEKRKRNEERAYPSAEHLAGKFSYNDMIDGSIFRDQAKKKNWRYNPLPPYAYEGKRDWIRFQLRAKPYDEIWIFLHPYFGFRIEKAVLIRQGKVIDETRFSTSPDFHVKVISEKLAVNSG